MKFIFVIDYCNFFLVIFGSIKTLFFLTNICRMPLKNFLCSLVVIVFGQYLLAQQTKIVYLSGTDKDHTKLWDFMVTKGRKNGEWSKIPVPSNWEFQGFGSYNYFRDENNPEEQGLYKLNFSSPDLNGGKQVFLVFEGSMTETEVKINGQSAGEKHQGGFYRFKYNITQLLKPGDNLLEATVSKRSENASINNAERKADFWLFGGIYRPVYLEIVPASFIERVAIDAKANGSFVAQVYTQGIKKGQVIEAQVQELTGRPVGKPFTVAASDTNVLKTLISGIRVWNQEHPNLYQVVFSLKEGGKTVHTMKQRFGFRTVEFRPRDGFYVNGTRIFFKGVCRHSGWPESGRALSRDVHLLDIGLMKEMNMNAVRMSHYPPDQEFLDLCDSLGLFVIDELTGWQGAYDTTVGRKLVKEMVVRDVNHPSVIIWSNGNEGGWNRGIDGDYHWYDPQKRFVMHAWERFNGTDTKHYPDFNYVTNTSLYTDDVFYPTEFMHGLFDGGHGAGLDDFWTAMKKHRYFAGGFLWALFDEGIVRADRHDSIDVAGNRAPDGIVGPHREKEGSFYTIKEIWSPVIVHTNYIPAIFDGKIEIENNYLFTNLNQCQFEWKLASLPGPDEQKTSSKIIARKKVAAPPLAPGEKGFLHLSLPTNAKADVLLLTAYDWNKKEIFTWSWPLIQPEEITKPGTNTQTTALKVSEQQKFLSLVVDGITYTFDKNSGYLQQVVNGAKEISLTGGPALANGNTSLSEFKHFEKDSAHVVSVSYSGDNKLNVTWTFKSGQLPRLDYNYTIKGAVDFMGITFNYPEEKIKGMKWLGRGPYRVWKNRLKGLQWGVWEKAYNNTITGESWNYPEFKGWHSDIYWVKLQNQENDFTVYVNDPNTFLYMLKPERPKAAPNNYTDPPFPDASIGFMQGISAIGTKFQPAEVMGPQSQKNMQLNYTPISGTLWFDFKK